MTAWLHSADPLWRLAGWTMIHFLWIGALVAIVGGAVRGAARRAAPNVRYGVSLVILAALAATPAGIAAWLLQEPGLYAAARGFGASQELTDAANFELRRDSPTWGSFSETAATPPAAGTMFIELKPPTPAPFPAQETPPLAGIAPLAGFAPLAGLALPTPASAAHPFLNRLAAQLPWLWLLGTPLTFAWLAAGLAGSRRLRCASTPLVDGLINDACQRARRTLGVTRRVALAVCDRVAQPVLVGIVRPTILLPGSALIGWTPEELEMVLLHELAHVRRWDNLVNLIQRVVESILFFHPAVWLASRQVRRDREECCDALVVAKTHAPEAYASLLVSIAAAMGGRGGTKLAASSTLVDHPLARRIRRILKLEDEPMRVSRSTLGLIVAMLLALGAAAHFDRMAAADEENSAAQQAKEANGGMESTVNADERRALDASKQIGDDLTALISELRQDLQLKLDDLTTKSKTHRRLGSLAAREAELAKLHAGVAVDRQRLVKINEQLIDQEVLKNLSIQSARSPATLDAAVADAVEKDPQIAMYQETLLNLDLQIQQLGASTNNTDNPALGRLEAERQQTKHAMELHRARAERRIRERLSKIPNEALRNGIMEYNVRVQALSDMKADLEQKLADAEARIAELTVMSANEALLQQEIELHQALIARLDQKLEEWQAQRKSPQGDSQRTPPRLPRAVLAQSTETSARELTAKQRAQLSELTKPGEMPAAIFVSPATPDEVSRRVKELNSLGHNIRIGNGNGLTVLFIVPSKGDASSPFLSLEDQKIADRAYKLLGLELEPLGGDELERVKKLGFDGGLRIVGRRKPGIIPSGDGQLLVGLHVWPITDLQALDAILSRDGLRELSPLKYYVVNSRDNVRSGRIMVELSALEPTKLSDVGLLGNLPSTPVGDHEPAEQPPTSTPPNGWQAQLAAVSQQAHRADKLVLIHFWTRDSEPCRTFDEKVLSRPEALATIRESFVAAKIDAEAAAELAASCGIDRVPTAVVATPNGDLVAKLTCPADAKLFCSKLEEVVRDYHAGRPGAEQQASTAPRLAPHDVIRIEVAGAPPDEPIEGAFTVEVEGTVALGPIYGRVNVAGQTIEQAEAAIEEHLRKILRDPHVQITLPVRAESVFLYDGKPFAFWRDLWKNELKIERRIEAIEALAAFGRAGLKKEAAEAILDVAAQYRLEPVNRNTPEGRLIGAILQSLGSGGISPDAWLPLLVARIEADPDVWNQNARALLSRISTISPQTRKLLLQLATENRRGPQGEAVYVLYRLRQEADPEVDQLIADAIRGEDRGLALRMLYLHSFNKLDEFPERIELLLDDDPAVAVQARVALREARAADEVWIAERMFDVLDDPASSARHTDAIRALVAITDRIARNDDARAVQELHGLIKSRLRKVVIEGPPELCALALIPLAPRGGVSVEMFRADFPALSAERTELLKAALPEMGVERQRLYEAPAGQ